MTDFTQIIAKVREHSLHVTADSRTVTPGSVFVAVPGTHTDGAEYIAAAQKAGASIIIWHPDAKANVAHKADVTIIPHTNPREALWRLARARYRTDTLPLRVLGITGTNGKTTCAYMLEHLFTQLGYTVGVCGTVNYRWPGYCVPAPLTTPDALTMHALLAEMASAGVDIAILEVSSHALDQERVGGIDFAGALFTNLTQDHLDYHADMEDYFAAKARLFTQAPRTDTICTNKVYTNKVYAINTDDAFGRRLLTLCPEAMPFGLGPTPPATSFPRKRESSRDFEGHTISAPKNNVRGRILSMTPDGLHLEMHYKDTIWQLRSPLVGAFNASNLLAVQALALGVGCVPEDMCHLEHFQGVPGRLERIPNNKGLNVFVDYAHTPDALTNVLSTLREAGFARVLAVFGCGGDRDRSKRPLMGRAVAEWADVAILTSDNPRNEAPMNIINDVLPGLAPTEIRPLEVIIEPDRRVATHKALNMLGPDDALVIAGKGHEDYQIIQGIKHPYSDQDTVREYLV